MKGVAVLEAQGGFLVGVLGSAGDGRSGGNRAGGSDIGWGGGADEGASGGGCVGATDVTAASAVFAEGIQETSRCHP
jgi:hypothetical protein